ncbi:MAG TPA: glycosyltransferase [Opitutaceae bacterium]|jgi:glycosyltransferase involved in cell wall biosynthesis
MRIAVLQDYLRSGGTERQSILLAGRFAAPGHDSLLVTFRPGGRLRPPEGCAHRVLQPFDTGLDWFGPGLMEAVLGDRDIVLCMGKTANLFAGRIQRRARSWGRRTRVVATLRAGNRLPGLYYSSVRRASHLVTNSREAADELVSRHGLEPAKVSVIRNSLVFADPGGGRDEALRRSLGAGPASTVLLSVAMFRPEKNQRFLLEMAAGLPRDLDWRLWLAGEGPARAGCERRAAELGLGGRVRFLGFQEDPGPLYRAADVAVHASREEALSNFLIEAQAHGLPAVACRALGIRECFVEGRTGWMLEHGDLAAFRAAVARLAGEPAASRAARSAEAAEFARGAFDPQRQAGKYISLFDSLLGEGDIPSEP